jgi:ankyrin repeat protein
MVARVRERCPGATEIRIEGCDDWAVELAKDEATLEVLKAGGAMMPEITAQNMNGLLIKYASKGAAPLVQLVLQAGANVNHVEEATALIMAAWSGHIDVVRILLDAGANTNLDVGRTALNRAAESGHIDVVRALLDAGASTDQPGNGGGAYWGDPLINAAAAGHIDVVRALLDAGAHVNTQDEYDETPLIMAAKAGHIDVVRALVDAGAELNNKTCTYSFGR